MKHLVAAAKALTALVSLPAAAGAHWQLLRRRAFGFSGPRKFKHLRQGR